MIRFLKKFSPRIFFAIAVSAIFLGCTNPIDEKPKLSAPKLYQPVNGAIDQFIMPKLIWTTVNDAAMYRLQISTSNSFSTIILDDSTITEAFKTISGLAYNKSYCWRIKAINTNENSPWSEIWSFSTKQKDTLALPALFQPANGATNQPLSLKLIWTNVSGAAIYELQVSKNVGFTDLFLVDSTLTDAFKTISGLSASDTCFWRVRAKNTDIISNWSNIYSFSTIIIRPPRITIDAIGTIDKGTYKNVTGIIEADTAISSVSYSIATSADVAVPSTQISISGPSAAGNKTMTFTSTNPIRITTGASATPGSYKLKISATAVSVTEASFNFIIAQNALEILQPKGGENYKVGQTVTITWKINDSTKISSVGIKLSLDNGKTYLSNDLETSSIIPPTTSFPWIIDSSQVSAQCVIEVYDYMDNSINDKSNFITITGGTPVSTATVTIGSINNTTVGSSIDLDNGTVLLVNAAAQSNSGVDLVGSYSTSKNAMRIFNPVYAKDSSNFTAFSGWVNPAATSFVKVPNTTTFASITTIEQIQPLYDNGTLIISSNCVTGDVFVVKTDQNKYVAIEIGTFDADIAGTCNIKYAK